MPTRPFARADLITGVILVVFGLAALVESYNMPRLAERHINPWTAPGVVPGLLAVIIALLGAVLALRSVAAVAFRRQQEVLTDEEVAEARAARNRLALCCVLCFVYAVVLIGHMPFWLATLIYVFVFIIAFEWQTGEASSVRLRKFAIAGTIAALSAIVIPYVFETLFLVRLP